MDNHCSISHTHTKVPRVRLIPCQFYLCKNRKNISRRAANIKSSLKALSKSHFDIKTLSACLNLGNNRGKHLSCRRRQFSGGGKMRFSLLPCVRNDFVAPFFCCNSNLEISASPASFNFMLWSPFLISCRTIKLKLWKFWGSWISYGEKHNEMRRWKK